MKTALVTAIETFDVSMGSGMVLRGECLGLNKDDVVFADVSVKMGAFSRVSDQSFIINLK